MQCVGVRARARVVEHFGVVLVVSMVSYIAIYSAVHYITSLSVHYITLERRFHPSMKQVAQMSSAREKPDAMPYLVESAKVVALRADWGGLADTARRAQPARAALRAAQGRTAPPSCLWWAKGRCLHRG